MRFQEEKGSKFLGNRSFLLNIKTTVLLMKNKWKLMSSANEVHETQQTHCRLNNNEAGHK